MANAAGSNVTVYNPDHSQNTGKTISITNPYSLLLDSAGDLWVLQNNTFDSISGYLDNGTNFANLPNHNATAIGPWGDHLTAWGGSTNTETVNLGEAIQGSATDFNGFWEPEPAVVLGEAQDLLGQEYITDGANNQVEIISADHGSIVATIATAAAPHGIAVDTINDHIYVSIPSLREVQVFNLKAPHGSQGVIR
ncbi:MAG TPA: hypothetical protein VGP48_05705 [Stellaceae bacterium]|nr:hypothetical protein [Stellaceae bacterium]